MIVAINAGVLCKFDQLIKAKDGTTGHLRGIRTSGRYIPNANEIISK